jgi:Protein of unknown function (DUF3891)
MVLYPLNSPVESRSDPPLPVWDAILRTQKQTADDWWLIAQSDHAELAGDMASRISLPGFPVLDTEVLQAVSLHDYGWTAVDDLDAPQTDGRGLPLSFFDVPPADIFRAWQGSISRAEQASPIGGILVSEHFCRIARDFVHAPKTSPPVAQVLTTFLERELDRQERLRAAQRRSHEEIHLLVDALQFCDLLSLYVCCGAREPVEFPQKFAGQTIRLWREGECCCLEPSVFGPGASLAVEARRFPAGKGPAAVMVPILFS